MKTQYYSSSFDLYWSPRKTYDSHVWATDWNLIIFKIMHCDWLRHICDINRMTLHFTDTWYDAYWHVISKTNEFWELWWRGRFWANNKMHTLLKRFNFSVFSLIESWFLWEDLWFNPQFIWTAFTVLLMELSLCPVHFQHTEKRRMKKELNSAVVLNKKRSSRSDWHKGK